MIDERINDEMALHLQRYGVFFRSFWDLGGAEFLDEKEAVSMDIDTAAILFNKDTGDPVKFVFAREFWDGIDTDSRCFVVCHEMLHVVLNHGRRFRHALAQGRVAAENMNTAADIVINELLVSKFGFERSVLHPRIKDLGCWRDTVFVGQDVPAEKSTDYYFNLIDKLGNSGAGQTIDKHGLFVESSTSENGDPSSAIEEVMAVVSPELLDKIIHGMSSDDVEDLKNMMEAAGNAVGGHMFSVDAKKKRKKKWESVIKKWELRARKDAFKVEERWDMRARRHHLLDSNGLFLPSDIEFFDTGFEDDKILVFFFLDTSGSCINYKNRFFAAAKSLDPKKFEIKLFCFDTRVYETTLESNKVYGGGGTSFHIIESAIQSDIKKHKLPYPKAVWIITDGYGNHVNPERPENWYWFLTPCHQKGCIPKKSKCFNLSDYE